MIVLTILGLLFVTASSIAEAIMDKVQFHYEKSIFSTDKYNQLFWNPIESWKNKWKYLDSVNTTKFTPGAYPDAYLLIPKDEIDF